MVVSLKTQMGDTKERELLNLALEDISRFNMNTLVEELATYEEEHCLYEDKNDQAEEKSVPVQTDEPNEANTVKEKKNMSALTNSTRWTEQPAPNQRQVLKLKRKMKNFKA